MREENSVLYLSMIIRTTHQFHNIQRFLFYPVVSGTENARMATKRISNVVTPCFDSADVWATVF